MPSNRPLLGRANRLRSAVPGALPPLIGVRKRIAGEAGYTEVGPVRLPFTVEGTTLV